MSTKLDLIRHSIAEVGYVSDPDIRKTLENTEKVLNEKCSEDRITERLDSIISWLVELTRAHKIKWFNTTPGIYASTEAHFCGYYIRVMKPVNNIPLACLPVDTARKYAYCKDVLYICVVHERTGNKVLDMVQHDRLNKLKAQIDYHLSNPTGDGLEAFYKSIENVHKSWTKNPNLTWK